MRKATTDKPILIMVSAEWDEASSHLLRMFVEMPASRPHCKFAKIDADEGTALVDLFEVDAVPALVIVHPHKNKPDVHQSNMTPEFLNAQVAEQEKFYTELFEKERGQAYRDIEQLVKSAPMFMFIKGKLSEPKCKFTRKLVFNLQPLKYRNIKTLNILENERIRQWLKFYTNWPTFPQVFIEGKFVGGVDVVIDMIEEGEFQ